MCWHGDTEAITFRQFWAASRGIDQMRLLKSHFSSLPACLMSCVFHMGSYVRGWGHVFIPHLRPTEPGLLDCRHPCWEHQNRFCVVGRARCCPEAFWSRRLAATAAKRGHLNSCPDSRQRTVCCLIRSLRHPRAAGGDPGQVRSGVPYGCFWSCCHEI